MDLFTLFVSFDPPVQAALGLVLLLALAGCVQVVVQYVLLHTVPRIRERMDMRWTRVVWHDRVLERLAHVAPSLVVQVGIAAAQAAGLQRIGFVTQPAQEPPTKQPTPHQN